MISEMATIFEDEDSDNYIGVDAMDGRFVRLEVFKGGKTNQELLTAENPEWVLDILIPILRGEAPQDEDECPLSKSDQKILLGLLNRAKKRGWFRG